MFHSPSCLCNACIVGVNAHGFFKSGGSGNLWCIFSIFPVTLFFLPPSMSLPTMHRFTCKLLSVVCGECTKFKHINKHFNFQIVSSLYSRPRLSFSLLPLCPCQTWGDLSPPFCPPPLQREGTCWYRECIAVPRVFCGISRSCWPLRREGGAILNQRPGLPNSITSSALQPLDAGAQVSQSCGCCLSSACL